MKRQLTPFEAQAHNRQYTKRDTREAKLGEMPEEGGVAIMVILGIVIVVAGIIISIIV